MATKQEKWQEIANRGLQDSFDPQTRARFDEAVKRGFITIPGALTDTFEGMEQNQLNQEQDRIVEDVQQFGRDIGGVANLAQNVATGIPARIIGGGAAIPDIIQGDAQAGLEQVQRAEENIQTPLSESGQEVATNLGESISSLANVEGIDSIVEGAKSFGDFLTKLGSGTTAFLADPIATTEALSKGEELTELPGRVGTAARVGGAIGQALPPTAAEVLPFVKPAAGIATVSKFNPANLTSKFGKNLVKNQKFEGKLLDQLTARQKQNLIAQEIKSGNPDIKNVAKFVNESGQVTTNETSKAAIKTLGGNDTAIEIVSVFERMSEATKTQVNKMLDIVKKGQTKPLFGKFNRPSDVLGDSLVNRAKAIFNVNKEASENIGDIARSLKGQKVNIGAARSQFFDEMEKLGVAFKTGDDGFVTVDLSRSDFIGGSQKQMNVMVNKLLNDEVGFEFAHNLKRSIRQNLKFDKIGPNKIDEGASAKILRDLSGGIDEVLDTASTPYNKANIRFAQTKDLVDKFQKLAGKDEDIFSDSAQRTLGLKAKRITSNAISGGSISNDIIAIDKVLSDLKIPVNDEIHSLLFAVDEIERIFNIAPSNSLAGNIMRTGTKLNAATRIAKGENSFAVGADFIANKLSKSEKKIFVDNLRAIRSLVKTKGEAPTVKKNTTSPVKPENKLTEIMKAEKPVSVKKEAVKSTPTKEAANRINKKELKDMGFDTESTWFHGSNKEFNRFDSNTRGENFTPQYGEGTYFASTFRHASEHGNVKNFKLSVKNPMKWSLQKVHEARELNMTLSDYAKSLGHDGIIAGDRHISQMVVFDNKNILSDIVKKTPKGKK